MGDGRRQTPFAVKAVVVCAAIAAMLWWIVATELTKHSGDNNTTGYDQIAALDFVGITGPRDGLNARLSQLVAAGEGSSADAASVSMQLANADAKAADDLGHHKWPHRAHHAIEILRAALTAQQRDLIGGNLDTSTSASLITQDESDALAAIWPAPVPTK